MLHMPQTRTDRADHGGDHASGCVHRRQVQMVLAAMPNCPADRRKQQRTTRDRFRAGTRPRHSMVPAPPVVVQRHHPRREPPAGNVPRRVSAPAPLVLPFVESVLRIGAVPVQLRDRCRIHGAAGHQNRILVAHRAGIVREEHLNLLALLSCKRQFLLYGTAQDYDATDHLSAGKFDLIFHGFPSLTRIDPVIEHAGVLEKLGEERQLSDGRGAGIGILLDMKSSAEGVNLHRFRPAFLTLLQVQIPFTHRVSPQIVEYRDYALFSGQHSSSTAVYRITRHKI